VLIRTGVSHFNREEMLGRELDILNIKGSWRTFWQSFRGEAHTIREWYAVEIRKSLRSLRAPLAIMLVIFAAALLIGGSLSEKFPLPVDVIDIRNLEIDSYSRLGTIDLLNASTVPVIWFHNLRTSLLALILGVFSFGVGGLLTMMLPFILIGYFGASFSAAGVGFAPFFAGLVLPHGIFEIPALALVGAGILYMGGRLIAPSRGKSMGEVMVVSLGEWLRVLVGVVMPLLLGAAVLETFLTPLVAVWLLN